MHADGAAAVGDGQQHLQQAWFPGHRVELVEDQQQPGDRWELGVASLRGRVVVDVGRPPARESLLPAQDLGFQGSLHPPGQMSVHVAEYAGDVRQPQQVPEL